MAAPDLLRLLDEHLAGVTGDEFFVALVKGLAEALDVTCSFVTEINPDGRSLTPLAFWCNDQLMDVPTYEIAGTPCECVLTGDIVAFDRDVVALFPNDRKELESINAESYLAIPLKNRHDRIMGHLAVIDSVERVWDDVVLGVFRIFAARATAELERRHFEVELAQNNAALERRVEERTRELEAANARLLTEVIRVQELAKAQVSDEARFRTLFEDSPIAIWELDLSAVKDYLHRLENVGDVAAHFRAHADEVEKCVRLMRIKRINRKTLDLYGAGEPRTLLEGVDRILLPESYEPIGQGLAQLACGSMQAEFELWDVTLDGERRLRHVQWSIPEAATETWNLVIVSIVDVTDDHRMREELRRAQAELEQRIAERTATLSSVNTQLRHEIARRIKTEEALLEQQEAYRDLYENAPNVYWSTGADGLIKRANQQAAKIFGYSLEELEGRPLTSLVADGPDGVDKAKNVFQRFLEGEPTYNEEVKFRAADGSEIWASVNVVPVFDSAGKPAHTRSLLTDITARKRLENELRLARAAAESASRAKSDFLASMSHELRTPLNAILGYAQLMEKRLDGDERRQQEVGGIRRAGEHLLTLINDLLDLASVEAGKLVIQPRDSRLRAVLRDVGEIVGMRASAAEIDFGWEVDENAPEELLIDDRRLRQILINLLGNALKFTPAAGTVSLQVDAETRGPAGCTLSFRVRDSGIGIPADKQRSIFEPFLQLESGSEGTGLGLSITRRLVEAMGGTIALESAPGTGSTFTVTLPAERSMANRRRTTTEQTAILPPVTVVDVSDERLRELLELARLGDVEAIERCLSGISDGDGRGAFVDAVRQMSRRYDMRGIQSWIARHLASDGADVSGPQP